MTGVQTGDCARFQNTRQANGKSTGAGMIRIRWGMRLAAFLSILILAASAAGQAATDPALAQADIYKGRALILRTGNPAPELAFDATGKPNKPGKPQDWTLSGFNLASTARRPDGALELTGTRVAIRYNPDQHSFERHVLKDATLRITFPAATAPDVDREMTAIFSTGIDPALQRALPSYWSHYFVPSLPWPVDGITDKDIVRTNAKLPEGAVYPIAETRNQPAYTDEARTDKVKGTVQLLIVVDPQGTPRRITVRQPLGYGLDERTIAAIAKWHFQPGTMNGVATPMEVVVNQPFDFVTSP